MSAPFGGRASPGGEALRARAMTVREGARYRWSGMRVVVVDTEVVPDCPGIVLIRLEDSGAQLRTFARALCAAERDTSCTSA